RRQIFAGERKSVAVRPTATYSGAGGNFPVRAGLALSPPGRTVTTGLPPVCFLATYLRPQPRNGLQTALTGRSSAAGPRRTERPPRRGVPPRSRVGPRPPTRRRPLSRASVGGWILRAPGRPVDLDRYALRVGSRLDQVERTIRAGLREQSRALAEDHRDDDQDQLVDQVVLQQAPGQDAAAVHLQPTLRLSLQLTDGGHDVSGQD